MRGLLIVNLGSPDSPNPSDVRTFLRDFLSDPDVIDFPRALWLPILHGIVLRTRPASSGALYETIWTPEGSPLVVHTRRQRDLLAAALPDWSVRYAMTYTAPSIASQLDAFVAEGAREIAVLPLYPQWAPSNTGSILAQVNAWKDAANGVRVDVLGQWPAEQHYVNWYADQIAHALAQLPEASQTRVILSYHGVPDRRRHRSVEYAAQCETTSSAIIRALSERGVSADVRTTYQSKFGPGKWLQPATIDTMSALPGDGVTAVILATPGFLADCIETIDELDVLNREAFEAAGGKRFVRVAPMNDDPAFADVVRQLLTQREASHT
ncbi:ferrochelatase [Trueperella pyogenes]|uniref:ferrochelatase n=1 Tax=Trueperella pyogenes TaxID=1661 RepID=UPI001011A6DE|nr:ferrochelatase [Trueperella pyogenes]